MQAASAKGDKGDEMNTARTVENAIKQVAIETIAVNPRLWIRTSRNQRKALEDNGNAGGEAFPQLYIAAATKYATNPPAGTYALDIDFTIATDAQIDTDGAQLADIEESLEGLLDALAIDGSAENARLVELIRAEIPAFNFGAFYATSSLGAPTYDDDARTLAQSLTLHFS